MLSGYLASVSFESLDDGEIKKEKWMDGWMDGCALYIMQIGLSSINIPKIEYLRRLCIFREKKKRKKKLKLFPNVPTNWPAA